MGEMENRIEKQFCLYTDNIMFSSFFKSEVMCQALTLLYNLYTYFSSKPF